MDEQKINVHALALCYIVVYVVKMVKSSKNDNYPIVLVKHNWNF